ncbi:hypothetical protein [Neobacillus fumarioli]|uniref:hypothetical protein n=1 Tax=Neobacillus fumarioli TaxID=105229 RepID=UPI000829DB1E|nr:hypothetical protein [Neobacillus fumarioli]
MAERQYYGGYPGQPGYPQTGYPHMTGSYPGAGYPHYPQTGYPHMGGYPYWHHHHHHHHPGYPYGTTAPHTGYPSGYPQTGQTQIPGHYGYRKGKK